MNPTVLDGPLTARHLDVLDVAVIEAMLLQALGPDSDAMRVHRDGASLRVELTPLGRATLREMAVTTDDPSLDSWMLLLTVGLIDEAVEAAGHDWRAEAELGVELACAERSEDVAAIAAAAARGPLVVDAAAGLGELLASRVCDAALAAFIC